MENHFVIRTYGFGELAQIYLPNTTSKSATYKFRKWININENLKEIIPPYIRELNPKMVKAIIKEFDLPESYMREFVDL